MRFVAFVLMVGATSPLVMGCGDELGTACTTEARASVQVTVVDAMGAAQKDAKVTFSVDGGAEETAECFGGSGTDSCDSWVAGFERTGKFVIKAVSADGMKKAETTVNVTTDECHVISQEVKLTLQ